MARPSTQVVPRQSAVRPAQPLASERRKLQPGRWHGSGAKVGVGSGRSGTDISDATQLLPGSCC